MVMHSWKAWAFLALMASKEGMLFVLGMQTITCAAYGIVLAWTRWQKAEWYMFGSVVLMAMVYFLLMPSLSFAYRSSELLYMKYCFVSICGVCRINI